MNSTVQCDRKWYQLHRSSSLFALVPLVFFVLMAIPGISRIPDNILTSRYTYFGWPYVHYLIYERDLTAGFRKYDCLEKGLQDRVLAETLNGTRALIAANPQKPTYSHDRSALYFTGSLEQSRFWSDRRKWAYRRPNSAGQFLWFGLAVNLSLMLGTSIVLAGIAEWRRRRRNRLLQFTTLDLVLGLLIIGSALGVTQYHNRQTARDAQVIEEITYRYPQAVWLFGPSFLDHRWIWRLSDNRIQELDDLLRKRKLPTVVGMLGGAPAIHGVGVTSGRSYVSGPFKFDPRTLAHTINRLSSVNTITLSDLDDEQLKLLEHLSRERITDIRFDGRNRDLRSLARFPNLRRLALHRVVFDDPDFLAPKLDRLEELILSAHEGVDENALAWIERLPELKVVYLESSFPVENLEEIRQRLPGVHVTESLYMGGGQSAGGY